MKKILSLFICVLMVLSLVACGNNEKPDETKKPNTSVNDQVDDPIIDTDDSDSDKDEGEEEIIRPNGELPNNERDLTDAEIRHYIGVIMNAALKLDIDTLKEYAKDESELEDYQKIADDPTTKEWYLKTIGQSVYIESTGSIAYPEPEALFQIWQTHFLYTNDVMPESVTALSLEELTTIYNQYKSLIPYVIEDVSPEFDCPIYLKDGRIYFELDELLGCTSYCYDTGDLTPPTYSWESPTKHIAAYVFGYKSKESINFSELLADGAFDYAMPLVDDDLSALVTYMDGLKEEYDWNQTPGEGDYYIKYYQAYIKNDTMRAKVQKWVNENVICGFSGHGFDIWYKINLDTNYKTAKLTAEEKAVLSELNICGWGFGGNFNEAKGAFQLYFDIIDAMIEGGYIENLV